MACRLVCPNWEPTPEQEKEGMVYLCCMSNDYGPHDCTVCGKCHSREKYHRQEGCPRGCGSDIDLHSMGKAQCQRPGWKEHRCPSCAAMRGDLKRVQEENQDLRTLLEHEFLCGNEYSNENWNQWCACPTISEHIDKRTQAAILLFGEEWVQGKNLWRLNLEEVFKLLNLPTAPPKGD